jgi:hypothetical protein
MCIFMASVSQFCKENCVDFLFWLFWYRIGIDIFIRTECESKRWRSLTLDSVEVQ